MAALKGKVKEANSPKIVRSFNTIFWIVSSLVCFLAYCLQPSLFKSSRQPWFGDIELKPKVKVVDWKIFAANSAANEAAGNVSHEDDEVRNRIVREVVKLRQPVILKNSPVTEWPAIELWADDAYLTSKVAKLNSVKQTSSKLFVYHEDRKYSKYGEFGNTVSEKPFGVVEEVSTEDFLTLQLNMQYSGRLGLEETNDFGDNEILPLDEDASPRKYLRVDDTPMSKNVFWLGQPNTTTSVHYDLQHNFVTQVRGTRRFMIYPPSASFSLVPHPYHHPRFRQSQLYYAETGGSSFWGRTTKEPVVADLEPGDLLYVPPFWWHRVESNSKGPSIQVNTWSPSDEESAFIEFVSSMPPTLVKNLWGTYRMLPYAKQYVLGVVTEVQKLFPSYFTAKGGPEEFIGQVIQAKYLSEGMTRRMIDVEPHLGCTDWKKSHCPKKTIVITQADKDKMKESAESLAHKFYSAVYANVTNPSDLDLQVADHYAGVVKAILSDFVENQLYMLLANNDEHGNICAVMRCMAQSA